ncbi:hypothetical protein LTR56_013578 [Elasticomyces elasticus]|nr:hypothetical protein LTR56_013578 [Elasticomyces elasticus]KAK3651042.1 hypothetical protein LTR22_012290 [Elasticomyces elasticus]KAK4931120.1 hypothetical protein LTR49_002536 [Elasticomyces elasticus]KAK5765588.1 hypothetical protein LTS12_004340 [Elasticomyces elasticus]
MALVVIETPELLEAILLDLGAQDREGLKTLLLSQRVCKTFMATIAGSVKLQRTLFFRPLQLPPEGAQRHEERFNTLLLHEVPLPNPNPNPTPFYKLWEFGVPKQGVGNERGRPYGIKACSRQVTDKCGYGHSVRLDLNVQLHRSSHDPPASLETSDSWQRMLLAQTDEALPLCLLMFPYSDITFKHTLESLAVDETIDQFLKRFWPKH